MSPSRRCLLASAAAAVVAGPAAAQRPRGRRDPTRPASDILRKTRESLSIPALSAAAARPDRLVWSEAVGVADVELARPADTKSRFRLGSCSKVVTAVAAMRLKDRGVLDLDRPIGGYLPDLPQAHRATTLRQLFAHLGGVRHYNGADMVPSARALPVDLRAYPRTADALAVFIADPLLAPPGETYVYSTFGFTLISAVLERAADQPFPEIIQREVSGPLGLTFAAETLPAILPDRVKPYERVGGKGPILNAPAVNPAYKWAGGGLIGTPSDLARMGAALLRPGFLSPASLDEMFRPLPARRPKSNDPQVGVAWRIDADVKGRRRFHHSGSIQGGRSGVVIYPDHGVSLALTSNLSDTPLVPLVELGQMAQAFGV